MRAAATPPKPDRVRRSTPAARIISPVTSADSASQIIRPYQRDPLLRPEFSDAQRFLQPTGDRPLRHLTSVKPIALMVVYVDTLHTFLHSIADNDRQRLADAHAQDPNLHTCKWWIDNVELKNEDGTTTTTGYRAVAQHPQPNLLRTLASLAREHRGFNGDTQGSITRCDFAIDFLPLNGHTKSEVDDWIFAHLIMPNRRPGPLWRFENSTYWNKNAQLRQNARDLDLYSDKPPKLPILGKRPISHVDSRKYGRRTASASGIDSVAMDVMLADPIRIIREAFYFTSTDIRPHAEAEAAAVASRYAQNTQQRDAYIFRNQLNTAQRVKERLHVAMPVDPTPPLMIVPKLVFL